MPFGIPNAPPGSTFELQAQGSPDSVDFDALVMGYQGTGTSSGLRVTAAPTGLQVSVEAGQVMFAGKPRAVGGGAVTLATADATNPRLDLIVVTTGGFLTSVTGAPSANNPVFPSLSSGVLLAAVYVAANATALTSAEIVDKRVQVGPVLLARVAELENRVDTQSALLDRCVLALEFLGVDLFDASFSSSSFT